MPAIAAEVTIATEPGDLANGEVAAGTLTSEPRDLVSARKERCSERIKPNARNPTMRVLHARVVSLRRSAPTLLTRCNTCVPPNNLINFSHLQLRQYTKNRPNYSLTLLFSPAC